MIVTGVDLETTGLSATDGHRIIEIALCRYDIQLVGTQIHAKHLETLVQRVNPLRAIDPGAQAVHGISLEMLAGQPEWTTVAPAVTKALVGTQVLVAHNMDFDGPFLGHELLRVGEPLPEMETFCTMQSSRPMTALGKLPSLAELAWVYGYDYDEGAAHAADYDIELTMRCFVDGLKKGYYQLPRALVELAKVA